MAFVVVAGLIYSARSSHPPPPPPPPPPPGPPSLLDTSREDYLKHAQPLWDARAERVKNAFVHAYDAYEKYAFPMDELLPITRKGKNK